ncbi:hypothetical protein UFOVP707_83 [uncultured Caudovirales phage]|uniref:Uncharacterized protein n=1 Tax=uncultured Caudovirales phage TaxID=2100421 RepID=A0A6J5NKK1_9CAUD|nr:hypothetical protein UFOVP707_83 [uncultured Caudovirales phage]
MNSLIEWAPPHPIPQDAWDAFVAMRKSKGKRNTWSELARDRAVAKLLDMAKRGVDVREVLLTCAEFGWVGVEWGEAHVARQAVATSPREGQAPTSRAGAGLAALQGMKR